MDSNKHQLLDEIIIKARSDYLDGNFKTHSNAKDLIEDLRNYRPEFVKGLKKSMDQAKSGKVTKFRTMLEI